MHGYNFTQGVRTVLSNAREASARLHHEYVGAEHMLLGILRRGEGGAIRMLEALDVDLNRVRTTIEEVVDQGSRSRITGPDLPYTTRAKRVLELAMAEARQLGHSYVGSEHLLLGLVREEEGIAAQALISAGVTLTTARAAMRKVLGEAAGARGSITPAGADMICRIWHGWTTPADADDYERLLRDEIFVGISGRNIAGFRRIELLRRPAEGEVEFVTIMWFESLDAVRAFAGDDYERAVVPASARALLARFDERSQHYQVREARDRG